MNESRPLRSYILSGGAIVLSVALLQAEFSSPEKRTSLDRGILKVVSPIQAAADWVVDTVGGWCSGYLWLVDVESENQQLRTRVQKLEQEVVHQKIEGALHRDLSRASIAQAKFGFGDVTLAQVISATSDDNGTMLRVGIEQGKDKVNVNHAVLVATTNSDGATEVALVGKVVSVFNGYADIQLASDKSFAIDARVRRSGARVLVKGKSRNNFAVEWASASLPLNPGDLIETSGFGGIVPSGISIGRVSSIAPASGVTTTATGVLAVDPALASTVMIVISDALESHPEGVSFR